MPATPPAQSAAGSRPLRSRRLALILTALAGATVSMTAAADNAPRRQPPGIPVPPAPGSRPERGPSPIEAPRQGAAATQPPPTPSRMTGADYERIQGKVIGNQFHIGPFAEPTRIQHLVEELLRFANLKNVIVTDRAITDKEIFLSQEIVLPVDRLTDFLISILEQNGATLVKEGDLYYIRSKEETPPNIEDHPLATTQVIPTRGLRPSALADAIRNILRTGGGAGGIPGMPAGAGGGSGGSIAYLDDLGVILITATPGRIAQVVRLVDLLVKEQGRQELERFELKHISAPAARQRLFDLLGGGAASTGRPSDPQQAALAAAQAAGMPGGGQQALSNIASRLIPDPKSNVLIFRGRKDETAFIAKLLAVIDTPNQLTGKFYRVGLLSEQLAILGKREGLGEIVTLPGGTQNQSPSALQQGRQRQGINDFGQPGGSAASQRESTEGGPMFVIDPDGRGFMYFGTEQQHERVAQLSKDFAEFATYNVPIFEFYKLKHAKAVDLAEVVQNLISNQVSSGSLLGSSQRDRSSRRNRDSSSADGRGSAGRSTNRNERLQNQQQQPTFGQNFGNALGANPNLGRANPLSTELGAIQASEDVFVLADEANNQIVVKAPKQLQPQFARLISQLDLRRPQVYIDAKIIAVTDNDTFRLAFETQILAMGDATGALNTNFGLGSLTSTSGTTTTGGFTSPKSVSTALPGLTAAIIRSDQVPIIIHAIASNTNARIISTPQLLVDDNFTAEISSLNRVPTSVISQSGAANAITSVGPDAEAGTILNVTPHISEGGYLNLEYSIELSSFTGPAVTSGGVTLPPPSQANNIFSDSVTLPSDSTIVIGGLTFENINSSVFKIPFLGDIPIIGQLFRDERKESQRTTLYVFITPRVMRDPSFSDLRWLTSEGPLKVLKPEERTDLPISDPARIEIHPVLPLGVPERRNSR